MSEKRGGARERRRVGAERGRRESGEGVFGGGVREMGGERGSVGSREKGLMENGNGEKVRAEGKSAMGRGGRAAKENACPCGAGRRFGVGG